MVIVIIVLFGLAEINDRLAKRVGIGYQNDNDESNINNHHTLYFGQNKCNLLKFPFEIRLNCAISCVQTKELKLFVIGILTHKS